MLRVPAAGGGAPPRRMPGPRPRTSISMSKKREAVQTRTGAGTLSDSHPRYAARQSEFFMKFHAMTMMPASPLREMISRISSRDMSVS